MVSSDSVTLSCPSHHEELVNRLWRHFLSDQATDFHVHVAGRSIRAHHLIVQLFLSPQKLGQHAIASKHKVSLDGLLEFVYRGTTTVERGQLDSLQKLADELDFPMLAVAVQKARSGTNSPGGNARRQRKGKPVKRTSCGNVNLTGEPSPESRLRMSRSSKMKTRGTSGKPEAHEESSEIAAEPPTNKLHLLEDTSSSEQWKNKLSDDPSADDEHINDSALADGTKRASNPAPEGNSQFKCDQCCYKTSVAFRLQNHVARRHDPTLEHLFCDVCRKTFRSAALLANHTQIHADQPAIYACPNCPYETSAVKNYHHHLRSAHEVNARGEPSPKRFRCADCPYTCIYPNKLRLHCEAVHSNLKNFTCTECEYRTGTKSSLRRHVQVTHLNHRPHLCHTCGFSTVSQSHLAKHLRMHSGLKPHVCGTCDARYASLDAYKMHVRRHLVGNEKPFVCDVCGYSCNRKDNLRVHLRKVHDRQAL